MPEAGRAVWVGVVASLALHLAMAMVLLSLPPAAALVPAMGPYELEIALGAVEEEGGAQGTPGAAAAGRPPLPEPGGGRAAQNVDARSRGELGDRLGASEVVLLLHRADGITLSDSPMNAVGVRQTQRIRTAADRATRDSRRATPNPDDQPFLASGPGHHPERRPVAEVDPRAGARTAPAASALGAREARVRSAAGAGRAADERGTLASRVGAGADANGPSERGRPDDTRTVSGGPLSSPGVGIASGAGSRSSESARVAHGRPPVDRGRAATQAEAVDARIRDDRDAEHLAASLVQSWVEASQRRGPNVGAGRGGVGGGGAPGSGGGSGEGGRASAHGPGDGTYASLDTSDRRYLRWHLSLRRRVRDRLDFPRARMLAMDQGSSVYEFTVRRNGSIVGAPRLVRTSGFEDLDRAARRAILAAAPFPPLPAALGRGVGQHAVSLRIEHSNPMVR